MTPVSVQEFKSFKENYVDAIFLDGLPWKSRIMLEVIDDQSLLSEIVSILDITKDDSTPESLNSTFQLLRDKTNYYLDLVHKSDTLDEKFNYASRAMVYDGILESLDELSHFTDSLVDKIRKKYHQDFFTIMECVDRSHLSVDVKAFKDNEQYQFPKDDPLIQKYLVLKDWQDRQHHYYLDEIEPFLWDLEKEYVGCYSTGVLSEIKNPQVLRKCRQMLSNPVANISDLAKCCLAGLKKEIVHIYGGKAYGLAVLESQGVSIPLTNVLPTIDISVEDISLDFTSNQYAVRSSADIEDGAKHSFAGMFDSYLGVSLQDLPSAVIKVKESVNNPRVCQYLKKNNLSNPKMGAVIQSFIEPDIAGVWMGSSLSAGYLEYVEGNGEKLVSGKVTPKQEDWQGKASINYIKDNDGQYIGEKLLSLQNKIGMTADFEWCLIKGKLVLLQFRPVTTALPISASNTNGSEYTELGNEIFHGIAGAAGFHEGPASYIRLINEYDINLWHDGDILMAWFTDPEWMEVLTKCSGIVTAVGGFLCHTAIIARELGIPCVIGIGQNMKKLWDSQHVAIDGTNGLVYSTDERSDK